jgi:hypothetical protein
MLRKLSVNQILNPDFFERQGGGDDHENLQLGHRGRQFVLLSSSV